jgi:glucuronoarabinoxylan endo-1,4-beta-xylanase
MSGADEQVVDGFGFSTAWCGTLSSAKNYALYNTLGFTLCRVQIDGIGSDQTANANAAHAAGAKVLGTEWEIPSQYATNHKITSGQEANYASWLHNAANTMSLDYVSFKNEPDGESWTPTDIFNFVKNNCPAIGKPIFMPECVGFSDSYSDPVINDSTAVNDFTYLAGHIYGGGLYVHQNALNHGKHVWMTEHYVSNSRDDMSVCATMAKEVNDCMNARMSAYCWWWVNDNDTSIDLANNNGQIYKAGYTAGQFAKFIRPGSTRVSATYNPQSNVYVTAYRVFGGCTIVAVNTGSSSVNQHFNVVNGNASSMAVTRTSGSEDMANAGTINVSGGSFTASLPATSVTTFVQNGTASTGVVFYQDYNYGGTAGQSLAKGTYTLSQLAAKGVPNDWASSVTIPAGWTVIVYSDDNFSGTSWTLTSSTPNFGALNPSANDVMSSCKIQ